MHFFNVQLDALPFAQASVHGLLGQRAVGIPPPMALANELLPALDGALMSTEQPSPGAGTTIRATVAADGTVPLLQGEGAIEGSYRSYQARQPSQPLAPPHVPILPLFCPGPAHFVARPGRVRLHALHLRGAARRVA